MNISVITCGDAVLHNHPLYVKSTLALRSLGQNFTQRNSATQTVPGSHIWAKGRLAKSKEIGYAETEPDSVIFWAGSTIRGGSANSCKDGDPESIRQMFAIGASRTPDENFFLSTPWHVWKALPLPVLERVGWRRTSGGAGCVLILFEAKAHSINKQ